MEQVTISLNTFLKEKVEKRLNLWGITWEDFIEDAIRDYHPVTEEMSEAMAECEEILKNPQNHKGFHSVDELFSHLEKECSKDDV